MKGENKDMVVIEPVIKMPKKNNFLSRDHDIVDDSHYPEVEIKMPKNDKLSKI